MTQKIESVIVIIETHFSEEVTTINHWENIVKLLFLEEVTTMSLNLSTIFLSKQQQLITEKTM